MFNVEYVHSICSKIHKHPSNIIIKIRIAWKNLNVKECAFVKVGPCYLLPSKWHSYIQFIIKVRNAYSFLCLQRSNYACHTLPGNTHIDWTVAVSDIPFIFCLTICPTMPHSVKVTFKWWGLQECSLGWPHSCFEASCMELKHVSALQQRVLVLVPPGARGTASLCCIPGQWGEHKRIQERAWTKPLGYPAQFSIMGIVKMQCPVFFMVPMGGRWNL